MRKLWLKNNSSLFSLDILSLDLVQVIKLLSSFIYFTVSRLSYWLLISNPVHNASEQYLFNLAKTLSFAWTNILVNNRWNLLLKLSELGFQPSKQGRQEFPRLILQSIIDETYILKLSKLGFQRSKQGRQELPGLILQSIIDETCY